MKRFLKKTLVTAVAVATFLGSTMSADAAGLRDIFNPEYYAEQYPDLKAAFGYDAEALYQHFLTYGLSEGRNANPIINVVEYREKYADLNDAFGDNWDSYVEHFFTYGIKENRDNGTDFDIVAYVSAYEDIQEAFGDDYVAIAEHYQTFGIKEERKEASKEYQQIKQEEERRQAEAANPQPPIEDDTDEPGENGSGNTTQIYKNADGSWEEYTFNPNNQIIKWTYYDASDNMVWWVSYERDEQGNTTSGYFYNFRGDGMVMKTLFENGNLIKSTFYDLSETTLLYWITDTYDDQGNCIQETTYNSDGSVRQDSIREYIGNQKTKETNYDGAGNVTSWYEYSGSFCIKNCVYWDGNRTESEFTIVGNSTYNSKDTVYYANGTRWEATYDQAGNQLTSINYDTNGNITSSSVYEYDSDGNTRQQPIKFTQYDASGNITLNCAYEYDENGIKTKEIVYRYDTEFNLNRRTVYEFNTDGIRIKLYDYNAQDILTNWGTFEYDSNGRNLKYTYYNANDELVFWTDYQYDANGNQTSITYNASGDVINQA